MSVGGAFLFSCDHITDLPLGQKKIEEIVREMVAGPASNFFFIFYLLLTAH